MTPYPDILYTGWSGETELVGIGQASIPVTLPDLPFLPPAGHYAQARVEIALVLPSVNNALGASSWQPVPPYLVAENYFQLFAVSPNLAELEVHHENMLADYAAGLMSYDQYIAFEEAYQVRYDILFSQIPPSGLPPVVTSVLPSGVFSPGETAVIQWSVHNPNLEDALLIVQGLQYALVSGDSRLNYPTGAAGGAPVPPGGIISGSSGIQMPDVGVQLYTGTVFFLWKRELADFAERQTNSAPMAGTLQTVGR